jgi:hypothetical protein
MLSEVTPGLQQLNGEAHPRNNQAPLHRERHPPNGPDPIETHDSVHLGTTADTKSH